MTSTNNLITIPDERIIRRIFLIRGKKVMLDRDLANLYGVTTGNFNKAVKRNIKRFPEDFMFQLTKQEHDFLRSQFATSRWGGTSKLPFKIKQTKNPVLRLRSGQDFRYGPGENYTPFAAYQGQNFTL